MSDPNPNPVLSSESVILADSVKSSELNSDQLVVPVDNLKSEESTERSGETAVASQLQPNLDPFVQLGPFEVTEAQLLSLQRSTPTPTSSGLSGNNSVTSGSSTTVTSDALNTDFTAQLQVNDSANLGIEEKTYISDTNPTMEMNIMGKTSAAGVITPSIVKPRRPSVHFAADMESKIRPSSSIKIESGGGSRKHRSRKEKLVCRSESPTDLGMDTDESQSISIPSSPLSISSVAGGAGSSSITVTVPSPITIPSLALVNDGTPNQVQKIQKDDSASVIMRPPPPVSSRITTPRMQGTGNARIKSRVKRIGSSNSTPRGGVSRKTIDIPGQTQTQGPFVMGGLKEPIVKKKKVIEIVSPRKRKMDHLDLVKKSSDPIFVRAANKPSKMKNKSRHNPFKFSRANLNRPSGHQDIRIRRPSSSVNLITGSPPKGGFISKRMTGSSQKKDPESEPPAFPLTCFDDLIWLLQEAEKEFSPDRSSRTDVSVSTDFASQSASLSSKASLCPSDAIAGSSSVARRLQFGRRRVESEPPPAGLTGFELPPGSPSGPQSLYQFRKEVYFSPSPSYAATGPAGRRRYSRRRHAKLHPPIDETNCYFQGHHCPNPKVRGSQFCDKHLDQGPSSGYSYCRYMKEGRQCGNFVPIFDPSMTFCEVHANDVARSEYELRNPKGQLDQTKNIISKIGKIYNEGFNKNELECLGASATGPDILQIIEEPDIIQELPLGGYTGGLLEELDVEGERNVNPDKPDYDALKNVGYYTTEEIIQIHIHKLKKLKVLYQREKELQWLTRQQKLKFYRDQLDKLKQFGRRFTTNPYLINKNIEMPKEYIEHQIREYDAAKAILQTAYKSDGQRGLLRLKMLQKTQELARIAKATGQKQHDSVEIESDSDVDSDTGESRDTRGSSRFSTIEMIKCAYNVGYAVRACQNPPVYWSNYCFKHILSDKKQVQWVPCNRRIGPDPQDLCKVPCFKILEKHGCIVHSPLVLSKHKPLRRSEEELNILGDSDHDEEEVSLESESLVLANLISDECIRASHLDERINRLTVRGPLEQTDTSDSEETDEEGLSAVSALANDDEEDDVILDNEINTIA